MKKENLILVLIGVFIGAIITKAFLEAIRSINLIIGFLLTLLFLVTDLLIYNHYGIEIISWLFGFSRGEK